MPEQALAVEKTHRTKKHQILEKTSEEPNCH
jgi:hypothetical protein